MNVIKRDGTEVEFDSQKIANAISRASKETVKPLDDLTVKAITNNVIEELAHLERPMYSVEEIQDVVETKLMESGFYEVAKVYVRYRADRTRIRTQKTTLMQSVIEKIGATNIENQNANVDEASFGGRKGEAMNAVLKQYALDYCMSDMAKNNHLNNEVYVHDLDSYALGMHNCLSIPFDDLLAKGFTTRQTDVRPANSINTAFQLVAVIFQLQSLQQFGGCSATHLDWTMVPYVRKSFAKHFKDGLIFCWETKYVDDMIDQDLSEVPIDDSRYDDFDVTVARDYAMKMTERELQQAVEGMYHNLNTLQSRSGNQLPFTSINYGTCTLPEGRMVTKALLEGSIKGVGKLHRTPIFPCGIFQSGKGINQKPGDPNYDLFWLALRSTSLRLYPNYVNVDWSGNTGYDKNDPRTYTSTMGGR